MGTAAWRGWEFERERMTIGRSEESYSTSFGVISTRSLWLWLATLMAKPRLSHGCMAACTSSGLCIHRGWIYVTT